MRIAFKDETIRRVCEEFQTAVDSLGDLVANSLRARLADLDSADTLSDLYAGNPGEVQINAHALYKIDLAEGLQLLLKCNSVSKWTDIEGQIRWPEVNYVQILEIRKTHD